MTRTLLLLPLILMSCGGKNPENSPIQLEELRIEVFGPSRELGYTNKQAGFFYTETNAEHRTGWQGWHITSRKILDDYALAIDGKDLRKSDVHLAIVSPHQFQRAYPEGVQETVTMLDSLNCIVLEFEKVKANKISVRPAFAGYQSADDFEIAFLEGVLLVARKSHIESGPREDYPVWIGLTFSGVSTDTSHSSIHSSPSFGPAAVQASVKEGKAVAVLVAGVSRDETISLAHTASREYRELIDRRRHRMEQVLNTAYVRTDNDRFDKALHWAVLSMDALIMSQGKKGIFAGLPWFSNYWGRDSFISLPGACLVTGNFREARKILRSFAEWQDKNPLSPSFGRIPNLVTPTSISYNTGDGTPWFVIALAEYVSYSGDLGFGRELYPVVQRAIEGALRHCDKNSFLTHGDAETWMDAVGPEGPWSPRGSRANDVQALWYRQLLRSSLLAELLGDSQRAQTWFSLADRVQRSLNSLFMEHSTPSIHDHLNKDGTPDSQFRPNQLLVLDLLDNQEQQKQIFRRVTERLVYPHGVASLWQGDPNFHPFHHYQPSYVQDAAYHNGIVWTWLSGPWIDAATRFGYQDLAFQVTENMVGQILDRGGVGTISELLDAAPRADEKEPRLSGTFTQAWSLAEFIRVFYQDYAGINVDVVEGRITLNPRLPSDIKMVSLNIACGSQTIRATYELTPEGALLKLSSPPGASVIDIVGQWQLPAGIEHSFASMLPPDTTITLSIEDEAVYSDAGGKKKRLQMNIRRTFDPSIDSTLRLAVPAVRKELAALKGPSHRLLSNSEVKSSNPSAAVLADIVDPKGDDRGPGGYVYPTTSSLEPGSLDIRSFKVSADKEKVYFDLGFENLSDPGWHPEYGFQLTYAAIAIDTDRKKGSGRTVVGRNANFPLPNEFSYEFIMYIGGGIRIENSNGIILAEYLPAEGDEKNPLGSVSNKTVTFSIPISILGTPSREWKYVIAVGAQDDHGGAGIGDFRRVEGKAGEWVGGGKRKRNDSNVFDALISN